MSESQIYDKFTNLFPLEIKIGKVFEINDSQNTLDSVFFEGRLYSVSNTSGKEITPSKFLVKSIVTKQFVHALRKAGFRSHGKYKFYKMENEIAQQDNDIFRIFEGFEFRILVDENYCLCIDPKIILKSSGSIEDLQQKGIQIDKLSGFFVYFRDDESTQRGYLESTIVKDGKTICQIIGENGNSISHPAILTKPDPRPEVFEIFLHSLQRNSDVVKLQRKYSFLDSQTPSKDRFNKTLELGKNIAKTIFPLKFGSFEITMKESPAFVKV